MTQGSWMFGEKEGELWFFRKEYIYISTFALGFSLVFLLLLPGFILPDSLFNTHILIFLTFFPLLLILILASQILAKFLIGRDFDWKRFLEGALLALGFCVVMIFLVAFFMMQAFDSVSDSLTYEFDISVASYGSLESLPSRDLRVLEDIREHYASVYGQASGQRDAFLSYDRGLCLFSDCMEKFRVRKVFVLNQTIVSSLAEGYSLYSDGCLERFDSDEFSESGWTLPALISTYGESLEEADMLDDIQDDGSQVLKPQELTYADLRNSEDAEHFKGWLLDLLEITDPSFTLNSLFNLFYHTDTFREIYLLGLEADTLLGTIKRPDPMFLELYHDRDVEESDLSKAVRFCVLDQRIYAMEKRSNFTSFFDLNSISDRSLGST